MPRQTKQSTGVTLVADGRLDFWLGGVVLGLFLLPLLSTLLQLYDRVQYWGKLVHALEAFGVTLLFGVLLLAWRDHAAVDISDQLSALLSMFVGILFGVAWEMLAFLIDWTLGSDLQKSNSDTMTDMLWNDAAAVVAGVAVTRLYCHVIAPARRASIGKFAAWLVDGPSGILDRNGVLVTIIVAALGAVAVATLWAANRFTL
jgi:hypothetical protein